MDKEIPKDLTFPKLRFKNVKEVKKLDEYGPPPDNDCFFLRYPHELVYVERLKITTYCAFNFRSFPFDKHHCDLSFGLSSSHIGIFELLQTQIRHKNISTMSVEKISIDSKESPVPFDIKLTSIKPYNESEYMYIFSYSGITLELKRSTPGLLFGGFYFPTGIFALLSLVSFSIDLQMVPGRLGLLVTLYLIMTNVYISVEGPKSRGFSYIEIWFVGMQTPILVGILEYAMLLAKKKYFEEQSNILKVNSERSQTKTTSGFDEIAKLVDKWTFVGCLIFIVLFSIIYCTPHL